MDIVLEREQRERQMGKGEEGWTNVRPIYIGEELRSSRGKYVVLAWWDFLLLGKVRSLTRMVCIEVCTDVD